MGTKTCCKARSLGTPPKPVPCGNSQKAACSHSHPQRRGRALGTSWHSRPLFPLVALCSPARSISLCRSLCALSLARCRGGCDRGWFITSPGLQKLPWPRLHGTARHGTAWHGTAGCPPPPHSQFRILGSRPFKQDHSIWGLLAPWAGAVPGEHVLTCPGTSLLAAGRFMCSCPQPCRGTENNTK